MCTILHLFAHVYMYVCRPVCGWCFPRLLSFYCRFWTAWGCCTCVEMCLVKCYLAITIMLVRVCVVVHLCSFLPTCWGHHVCGTLWKVPEIAEERQDKSGARTAACRWTIPQAGVCLWWSGFLPKTLWSLEKKPEQCCLQWSVFTTYTWCQLWKWGWD